MGPPVFHRSRALARRCGRPQGGVRKGVIAMWRKLFGRDDGLPRAKVDAVVRIVDRYLSEEAEFRGLRSEKQAVHPRDLPPVRRQALVEEVFAILGETEDRIR